MGPRGQTRGCLPRYREAQAMKPMRIAFNALTLPSNLAGVGFYACKLLEALAGTGACERLTLFTNSGAAASLPSLPAPVDVVALPAASIAAKVFQSQFGVARRLRGYDLLHSVGNVACLPAGLPQVVTIHDLCHRMVPKRFGFVKRAYLECGMRASATGRYRILAVSENTRQDLIRCYPRAGAVASTVHSACKFPIATAADPAGREDGHDGGRGGFLFVGTLEPGKNLALALRALAALRRRGHAASLRVIGAKGWKQSHIPGLVESLGLSGAVDFAGYLDEAGLRQAYRSARALVFPSAYEGFGFPILEAQSQGCPVIAADNSCQREIGGEAAFYFRDGDAEGLAALMERCVKGDPAFPAAREKGFANCRRFSWERTAAETLEVYYAALGRPKDAR